MVHSQTVLTHKQDFCLVLPNGPSALCLASLPLHSLPPNLMLFASRWQLPPQEESGIRHDQDDVT